MGEIFLFENETTGEKAKLEYNNSTIWLQRNIDRYGGCHLLNVFLRVIELEGWSKTDTVCASACSMYTYTNGELYSITDPDVVKLPLSPSTFTIDSRWY
jgi:hypothetical protein